MNIFFTASLRGKEKYLSNYKRLYNALSIKHKVFADHVFNLELEEVSSWEPDYHFDYYVNILNKIKECDCFVVELTSLSINIEYEVSLALNLKKNILAFYWEDAKIKDLDFMDLFQDKEKIQLITYNSDNLEKVTQTGLKNVKNNLNKRFTILLPTRIVNYLEKNSKDTSVPISVYIRQLIEAQIAVN